MGYRRSDRSGATSPFPPTVSDPMRRIQVQASRPDVAARPVIAAASLTLLMVALAIVLFTAMRTPMKDDIAWLLYVARRWLAGRELYVDVIEVNPPLIVWISAIPIQFSAWLGIDPQRVVIPYFAAVVLACAGWTASLLRPCGSVFRHPWPVFAAIGTVLLLVPGDDLGQREHLLVAAALPYLALFARLERVADPRSAVEVMLEQTGLLGMIGKAERGPAAIEAIRDNKAVYLMAVGGAAYLVSKAITSSRLVAFEDLGMEAIYEFEVKDMPVTVAVDAKGTSVHQTGPAEWQHRIANIPILV